MGYSKKIYDEAAVLMMKRRNLALHKAALLKDDIFAHIPKAKEILNQISRNGVAAAKAAIKNKNTTEVLDDFKNNNLELRNELKNILAQYGYSVRDLMPYFNCTSCCDKGYIDGKICVCMKRLVRDVAIKNLNSSSILSSSSFETFNVAYYADVPDTNGKVPRQRMEKILHFCRNYAENFSEKQSSILMSGGTGLGKSHLSMAIAQEVVRNGYSVIYCSAPDILNRIEEEHFSNRVSGTKKILDECDLLIVDDLGAELPTNFTKSVVYNIINNRMLKCMPIIVITNLTLAELQKVYSDRLISRFIGEHIYFQFIGEDIRFKKSEKRK